jgi:transcriptional regulator with XRE-family HTH domain
MLTANCKHANRLSWLNHGMEKLQQRLEEVMRAKNWDGAKLAKVSGASRSLVSQWLGNASRPIKKIGNLEAAKRIEAESGFCALWIAQGIGPKFVASPNGGMGGIGSFASEPVPAPYGSPPLRKALPVVLDAIAAAKERDKLRAALLAFLDDDAPAYRQRLAELLGEATDLGNSRAA